MPTHIDLIALDAADPLAGKRALFSLPEDTIYLDGNSLGAMPTRVASRLRQAAEVEWAQGLIRSWNDADWYPAPQRVGGKIGRLIGAADETVIACDSTSVNLFKVLVSALRIAQAKDPRRNVILTELGNFPTDLYIAQSVARLTGAELLAVPTDQLQDALHQNAERLAIAVLTHVNYKSGKLHDMPAFTANVQRAGGLMCWDLAHSAGTLAINLEACKVDFAVGCGYKYLNGGPGAPAFVYVATRHHAGLDQPLAGWHGHAAPFAFTDDYRPHAGIDAMLCGTAPQLSLLALEEALNVFEGLDLKALENKGKALGDAFIALVQQELSTFGFGIASPIDAALRGSQVALTHANAYAIMQALIARGVIGDFREPNILRFGFAGLYVRFVDVWNAVATLKDIMQTQAWKRPEFVARKAVT